MMEIKTNAWNRYVGKIWAKIFSYYGIRKNGVLIEIAPGNSNKIGYALSLHNFEGTLYIIDPNPKALTSITKKYKKSLKNAKIIPIKRNLYESLPLLPKKVHAIISNHPLDDMILGKILDNSSFIKYFGSDYGSSSEKTKKLWQEIEADPKKLKKIKLEVVNEWNNLIKHTNPDIVIISQYESFFFKRNKIYAPDKHAFEVLKKIKNKCGGSKLPVKIAGTQIKNREKWLVIDKRSNR